jgi:hypothetical protein
MEGEFCDEYHYECVSFEDETSSYRGYLNLRVKQVGRGRVIIIDSFIQTIARGRNSF